MIIVCQKCTQRYHLDPISLGEKGRKVRCASCKNVWFQETDALSKDPSWEETALVSSSTSPSFLQRFCHLLIRIILVGSLVGGGWFAFSVLGIKQWLIHQIPSLEPLFGIMNITATEAYNGLEIRNIKVDSVGGIWEGANENGKTSRERAFIIKGEITNTSSQVQILPPLKISLKGTCKPPEKGSDCLLQEWTHELSQPQILPGEVLQFEISLDHRHPPGSSFFVSF